MIPRVLTRTTLALATAAALTATNPSYAATIITDADAHVWKGATDNTNYGSSTQLQVQDFSSTSSLLAYVRFDLSGYTPGSFTTATLDLTSDTTVGSPAIGNSFYVWGLRNSQNADGWGENTITYNNAPGLDGVVSGDGEVATLDVDTTNKADLLFTTNMVASGNTLSLSNAALLNFLNADTDGKVTFIIGAPKVSGDPAFFFASEEHATLAAPTLNVQVGSSSITFTDWQTANSTTGDSDDDHDADGVMNGIEYFLSGNTDTAGFTALPGLSNNSGVLSITWTKAAGYAGTYGTHYWVETSESLTGAWTPETLGVTVTLTGNDVKYTFPSPLGAKKFAHLVVTGP